MPEIRYSIVVAACNEEAVIAEFHRRITSVMQGTGEPYEIIFVDDGSRDGTYGIIRAMAARDPAVKVIRLSRTFGHQVALTAGLDHASGVAVVTMDADLQDPPETIPLLIERWKAGYAVVHARRTKRLGESAGRRACAFLFHRLLRRFSDVPMPVDVGDFRLLDAKACTALRRMPERHRYLRGLAAWAGFTQTEVLFERQGRLAGKSKYTSSKRVRLAVDAAVSFSPAPLRAVSLLGVILVATGAIALPFAVAGRPSDGSPAAWGPILAALILLANGITVSAIGLLGIYIRRIFEEVKRRPLYLVSETIGLSSTDVPAAEDPPCPT
jgi:polyisoprenyl-phosphate glycosyltransferase